MTTLLPPPALSQLAALANSLLVVLLAAAQGLAQQGNTTVQLPTFGVAIDALGVLRVQSFPDPDGRLQGARLAAARSRLPGDLAANVPLRKIGLIRLENHLRRLLDAGQGLDDTARHLAGLTRLQYVFFYPDEPEVVIAGPAEGWGEDLAGRAVGLTSGRPVLLLEDLAVALRAYAPGTAARPFVGCTIDPSPESLARLQQFQQTIPRTIPQAARDQVAVRVAQGLRDSLGSANIRVFGIPAQTHFAQVLVEADYRMKRIGVGMEPPPVKMVTFIEALSVPQHAMLQRWWFVPNYQCVRLTADRLGMELDGDGVRLSGEDLRFGPDGRLGAGGEKPNKASELFTASFTQRYGEIARRSPVYAQLRNLIDLLVAAAFIRQQDYYGRANWTLATLGREDAFPVQQAAAPQQVDCVVQAYWKGNRLLAPAGGGVSILAHEALAPQYVRSDDDGHLAAGRQRAAPVREDRWWWD